MKSSSVGSPVKASGRSKTKPRGSKVLGAFVYKMASFLVTNKKNSTFVSYKK